MQPKLILKMMIDLVMTALLLCQMAYIRIGETAHEWLGAAMFLLFIAHHILNRTWYQNLLKGRYSAVRILQTAVNILVFLSMIGLMVSGIILSRAVFAFLSISGRMGFARTLHMLASYWGFILMSAHLGLHWGMVMGAVRKMTGRKAPSRARTWVLRLLALTVCCLGIYTMVQESIGSYLFLKTHFVFIDMEQPLALFFAEYLAVMGLWACIAYYAAKFMRSTHHIAGGQV